MSHEAILGCDTLGPVTEVGDGAGYDRDTARSQALIEEACRKSALLWLRPEQGGRFVAAWHVWFDGAALVVSGGLEQDLHGLDAVEDGGRVEVSVRSKDTGGRLVTWVGRVERLAAAGERWPAAAAELHAKRLNPPDGEDQPLRWARESVITRIAPTGELRESPGHQPTQSHAAEPPDSPATTRGRLPFTVGRPARRRR